MLEKWGHLTLLEEVSEPEMAESFSGPYPTGAFLSVSWRLKCDCGTEFSIYKKDFPGRRRMRDCGKECNLRIEKLHVHPNGGNLYNDTSHPRLVGRPWSTVPRRVICLSIPAPSADRIRDYAIASEISFARAVVVLTEIALNELERDTTRRAESQAGSADA